MILLDNLFSVTKYKINGKNIIILGENHNNRLLEYDNISEKFVEFLDLLKDYNYEFMFEKNKNEHYVNSLNMNFMYNYCEINKLGIYNFDFRNKLNCVRLLNNEANDEIASSVIIKMITNYNKFIDENIGDPYLINYCKKYISEINNLNKNDKDYYHKVAVNYIRYSDLELLNKILNDDTIKNICVIVGEFHALNIKKIFKKEIIYDDNFIIIPEFFKEEQLEEYFREVHKEQEELQQEFQKKVVIRPKRRFSLRSRSRLRNFFQNKYP